MKNIFYAVFLTSVLVSCSSNGKDETDSGNETGNASPGTPVLNYSVKNVLPHDTTSFTEGLVFYNGQLFESTGGQPPMTFKSFLGPVDLKTGVITKKVTLDTAYFGEGINFFNNKLYQLTWEDKKGFIYDPATYKKLGEFQYNTEGWALTNDGQYLIMSDGTSNLQFLDPQTMKVAKVLGVTDENGPVANINELEFIKGFIYANKYGTNEIIKIDPGSGKVTGKLDFGALDREAKVKYPGSLEMNGIAYDSTSGRIIVTGKAWPHMYEVSW